MTDWTGSTKQRREQGMCLPPSAPRNSGPRYTVPIGTEVWTCRVSDIWKKWRRYRTQVLLTFARTEQIKDGQCLFRHEGWFIRVPLARIEDSVSRERNPAV